MGISVILSRGELRLRSSLDVSCSIARLCTTSLNVDLATLHTDIQACFDESFTFRNSVSKDFWNRYISLVLIVTILKVNNNYSNRISHFASTHQFLQKSHKSFGYKDTNFPNFFHQVRIKTFKIHDKSKQSLCVSKWEKSSSNPIYLTVYSQVSIPQFVALSPFFERLLLCGKGQRRIIHSQFLSKKIRNSGDSTFRSVKLNSYVVRRLRPYVAKGIGFTHNLSR